MFTLLFSEFIIYWPLKIYRAIFVKKNTSCSNMAKSEKGTHFKQYKRYMAVMYKVVEVDKFDLASLYPKQ